MKLSYIILNIIQKKYSQTHITSSSKLFEDLNIDSLEFVKLVAYIEKKTKKKINLSKINDFQNIKIAQFVKLFL